jgi:hypothetical protein
VSQTLVTRLPSGARTNPISLNVTLPLKYGKRPSGYAFVGYAAADVAQKAIDELNEKSKHILQTNNRPRLINSIR